MHEVVHLLCKQQSDVRAAPQTFLRKQDIGAAGSAADCEIPFRDVPFLEMLCNSCADGFCLGGGKARSLAVRRVNHMAAADNNLVEARGRRQNSLSLCWSSAITGSIASG